MDNDKLGFVKKNVYFAAGKVEDLRHESTATSGGNAEGGEDLKDLGTRLDQLSSQVDQQKQELGRLEAILQEIFGFIKQVFGIS